MKASPRPKSRTPESELARARIRPARTEEDLVRATEFLKTPRVGEIVDGHPEERGAVRLCEVDDELVGALLLDPSPLSLRGIDIRCARIIETGGEDGRLRFRRTGDDELFVLLLEEALGYIWVRRYPIAYVHGELALYPANGFVPCFYHPRVYVDVAAALELPSDYRVRHLKADDVGRITELKAQNRYWKPMVFATGVPPFHHFCVEGPGRRLKGYFSVVANAESKWSPRLYAPEIEVEDRKAACTVVQHCARKAHELGLEEMHFPLGAGHPVARLCLELGGRSVVKGAGTNPFLDEEMIHLVDPARFVASLQPFFAERLAGSPHRTASLPIATGSGCWVLRLHGGKVAFAPAATKPEGTLELPHWKLTQMLAGYRGADELDVELAPEQEDLLHLLFPKTWPWSVPDPDHFDAVQPPRPYSEAAAAVVAQTRLPWTLA